MNAAALYEKYAQESFQNSYDHGFWEGGADRSKGEMVMLMLSELGECQEAHRKSRIYAGPKQVDYRKWCIDHQDKYTDNPDDWKETDDIECFKHWFVLEVKDSCGDELADVCIRVMDFVHGWRCHFLSREVRKESTGNFSHDLLRLSWYVMQAFHDDIPGRDWGYALEAVCKFADWWSIDLDFHIQNKQAYNRTRPVKHGKLY